MISYRLNDLSNRKLFREVPGVYALVYDNKPIYIGETDNIMRRMGQHVGKSALRRVEKEIEENPDYAKGKMKRRDMYRFIDKNRDDIYFCVLKCGGRVERCKKEKEMIEKHLPRYNYEGIDIPYRVWW